MTVEEIKAAYSMRDIVERYGFHPTRAGFIPCPFHSGDRQPSLKVYDRDFHCHACGANGDIFTFVQMMDDVDFRTAYQSLGGVYEKGNRKAAMIRCCRFVLEKQAREKAERQFREWRATRFLQVCRLLRMLDEICRNMEPFTDEWEAAMNMRQDNWYKYLILAFGTREEQEEMRELDE